MNEIFAHTRWVAYGWRSCSCGHGHVRTERAPRGCGAGFDNLFLNVQCKTARRFYCKITFTACAGCTCFCHARRTAPSVRQRGAPACHAHARAHARAHAHAHARALYTKVWLTSRWLVSSRAIFFIMSRKLASDLVPPLPTRGTMLSAWWQGGSRGPCLQQPWRRSSRATKPRRRRHPQCAW